MNGKKRRQHVTITTATAKSEMKKSNFFCAALSCSILALIGAGYILHLIHTCCLCLTALKIEDVSHDGEKDNNEPVNSFRYVKTEKKDMTYLGTLHFMLWSMEH